MKKNDNVDKPQGGRAEETAGRPRWTRWFGRGAGVAILFFLAGRIALEPLRPWPRFDNEGMDPFSAVEVYRLRNQPDDFTVAIFGSSVSIWGVLPEEVAQEIGESPLQVRKLAVQGGTPFDMWHLVKRNPSRFEGLSVAVIELNPRMFDEDTEAGRMRLTAGQHATWAERRLMFRSTERILQEEDYYLPLYSLRRPLKDLLFDIVVPLPNSSVLSHPDQRLAPFSAGWDVPDDDPAHHYFVDTVSAEVAASRLATHWRLSRLYDHSLHELLQWFSTRGVRLVFHQLPVHPALAREIETNEKAALGYQKYLAYVESLDLEEGAFWQNLSCLDCDVPIHGMRDHTHLNKLGARIYSRLLGKHIRRVCENPGSPRILQIPAIE